MAKPKKEAATFTNESEDIDLFSADLLKTMNREVGRQVAYNLTDDDAPTIVNKWIETGSPLLDAIIANGVFDPNGKKIGGLPGGRIIEIFGAFASGKSTLAQHIARGAQRSGGIVVYIDTENATSIHNLQSFGIDINNRFVFVQPQTIEEVFQIADIALQKSRNMKSDVPVLIIWDSLAATATKAEVEGAYDQQFMGIQARAISQGLKKINNQITTSRATFLVLNQMRQKIGVMFGDPWTTSGGAALPYYASLRLKLSSTMIKDGEKIVGTEISVKTVKNKVGRPFREVDIQLLFGKGVRDSEPALKLFSEYCKLNGGKIMLKDKFVTVETGAWNKFNIFDKKTGEQLEDFSFRKADFASEIYYNPKYKDLIREIIHAVTWIDPKMSEEDKLINDPTYNKTAEDLIEETVPQD